MTNEPTVTRIARVAKTLPASWLRAQDDGETDEERADVEWTLASNQFSAQNSWVSVPSAEFIEWEPPEDDEIEQVAKLKPNQTEEI